MQILRFVGAVLLVSSGAWGLVRGNVPHLVAAVGLLAVGLSYAKEWRRKP